jgi:hypothetical protein
LLPREYKTANCFEALEAAHKLFAPVAHLVADEHRRYREGAIPHCRATARPRNRYHRACKQRKPAHSKATPVTKESPHSDQCPRRPRRFQPDTTTSPVSRPTTMRSLQQCSVVSRSTEIPLRLRNSSQMFAASITAKLRLGIAPSRQNQACDVGY